MHEAEMCVVRKSSRRVKKLARASPVIMEELRRGCDLVSPSGRLAVAPALLTGGRLIKYSPHCKVNRRELTKETVLTLH